MRFFLRALSLVVAGVDMYIILRWEGSGEDVFLRLHPAIGISIMLIFILTLIWFGDSLSEREEELGRWCPALLLKIVGWCTLLVPIVIFVLNKIK